MRKNVSLSEATLEDLRLELNATQGSLNDTKALISKYLNQEKELQKKYDMTLGALELLQAKSERFNFVEKKATPEEG